MVPCCFTIISREEYDRLVEKNAKRPMLGGAFGKHHYCPKNAEEAHQILSGNSYIQVYEKYSLASIIELQYFMLYEYDIYFRSSTNRI